MNIDALLHDPIIALPVALSIAYIGARIVVAVTEFITEYDYDYMSKGTKLLKKLYYNRKYNLQRKLNHFDYIENHYIVTKHNICAMIETITAAIVNYRRVDGDENSEILIALIKIHEIMEQHLLEIINNPLAYSTSDLRYIYANVKRFCEYMSNEWYLTEIREIDNIVLELEIDCLPYFITLSKHIQTIASIDNSDDLLQLMKKEIPLEVVA